MHTLKTNMNYANFESSLVFRFRDVWPNQHILVSKKMQVKKSFNTHIHKNNNCPKLRNHCDDVRIFFFRIKMGKNIDSNLIFQMCLI